MRAFAEVWVGEVPGPTNWQICRRLQIAGRGWGGGNDVFLGARVATGSVRLPGPLLPVCVFVIKGLYSGGDPMMNESVRSVEEDSFG